MVEALGPPRGEASGPYLCGVCRPVYSYRSILCHSPPRQLFKSLPRLPLSRSVLSRGRGSEVEGCGSEADQEDAVFSGPAGGGEVLQENKMMFTVHLLFKNYYSAPPLLRWFGRGKEREGGRNSRFTVLFFKYNYQSLFTVALFCFVKAALFVDCS